VSEVLWTNEQQRQLADIVGPDDPLTLLAITQDVALPDAIREVVADLEYRVRTVEPTDLRKLLENERGEFDPDVARSLYADLARACELAIVARELVRSQPFKDLGFEAYDRLQRASTWLR
jgi:hypothetical protein